MKQDNIIVIGAGVGGLCAAIYLASRGKQVQVFEQNATAGGKMNEMVFDGYRFDTGPSLMTMPFVLDGLRAAAGTKFEPALDLVPIDPICRYFWSDGTQLNANDNFGAMQNEIEKLSSVDGEAFPKFMQYSKRIYDLTADIFLLSAMHEWQAVMKWRNVPTLFRIHQIDPFRSVHQGVSRFFKHPKIVQLFDRYATYNGSNPYMAPATLNIIPWVEYGLGGYYIKGGMYRLIETLHETAVNLGVQFHFNSSIEKIIHKNKHVQAVQVSGEHIPCDAIVSNADVVDAFNRLIDGFPKQQEKLNSLEPSLSGLVFLWGIKQQHPQLAQHNIVFSDNYQQEFIELTHEHTIPDDPTIYIAITSKQDSSHAPNDCENWFVLVNTPYLDDTLDWQTEVNSIRNVVLRKLRSIGINLESLITTEKLITPADLYSLYSSNKGSIYGISSNDRSSAFRRPANRNRQIQGLYFAGGSTHPGGGVPLAMLSGKICADLICGKY